MAGDTLFAEVSMQRDAVWGLAASRSELFGWGEAEDGALGLGDPPPAAVPEPIWIVIEPGADLQGSTGGRMGCYRLARGDEPGDVFCAGQNDYGELGREPGEPASTFAPVPFFE